MIAVLVAQTNILNAGLKHFEALKIVPVFITFCKYLGLLAVVSTTKNLKNLLWQIGSCSCWVFGIVCWDLYTKNYETRVVVCRCKGRRQWRARSPFLDRLSRDFRTSVHLPLMSRGRLRIFEHCCTKGKKVRHERLRRSMTSDDIKLLSKGAQFTI